jgi:uncharacterized protein (TIGR03083 family)
MLPERHLAELAHSLDVLGALASRPEDILDRPVPACPGWTLDVLFGHLGSIERWAAGVVRAGKFVEEPAAPTGRAAPWFLEGAPGFLAAMASVDPAAPCWNFGPHPRTAGFWLRRQAHEHAVHLVDAHQAAGLADPVFSEEFLLDGIDEALAMFAPRQLRLGRMTDPENAVTFTLPDGTAWTVGEGDIAATVIAAPQEMYLGLWGRSSLSETAALEGDADLALRVIRGPLTP